MCHSVYQRTALGESALTFYHRIQQVAGLGSKCGYLPGRLACPLELTFEHTVPYREGCSHCCAELSQSGLSSCVISLESRLCPTLVAFLSSTRDISYTP